jgi:hypothetical protein
VQAGLRVSSRELKVLILYLTQLHQPEVEEHKPELVLHLTEILAVLVAGLDKAGLLALETLHQPTHHKVTMEALAMVGMVALAVAALVKRVLLKAETMGEKAVTEPHPQ